VGIFIAPFIAISRHYLNYHSVFQIICGAISGFVWTIFFFTLMVILIHHGEGKFYSSKAIRTLKKLKFTCNLVSFHEQPRQEDTEAQTSAEVKLLFTLPLREKLMFLFKKTVVLDPAKVIAQL